MYSRRQFLARTMWLALLPTTVRTLATPLAPSGPAELTSGDLETLAAAMDEIIPAGGGMPLASMAGGPRYLQYLGWQYPAIQEEINRFLKTLAQASTAAFQEDFRKLRPDQRVRVLASMEKNQAPVFSAFVGYVYESYYTNPKVLGLISCSPSPSSVEPDEALLAPVRKLTRYPARSDEHEF